MVIGPFSESAALRAKFEVLPDLPNVKLETPFPSVTLVVFLSARKDEAKERIVTAPVVVKKEGLTSNVKLSNSSIIEDELLVTNEPSAPNCMALAADGLK
jgi:hypothetical protein